VENTVHAFAGRVDGAVIRNIGLDDLQVRIAVVLRQIGATADNKAVKHTDATAFLQKAIDKVAANKAATARD
jgi:hypothetical protein